MSTSVTRARRSKSKGLLALLTSVLVALSGLFVVPAATAAPLVTVTEAPREGGQVTVTGAGFDGSEGGAGIYVGLGPAGLPGFYTGASSIFETVWVAPSNENGVGESGRTGAMNPDGSFSVTFDVPAFEEGTSYALYTSKAHGQGFADPSQNSITEVKYAPVPAASTGLVLAANLTAVDEGDSVTLSATVTPADAVGSVQFFDGDSAVGDLREVSEGKAGYTVADLSAGTHSFSAVFVPADENLFEGSTSNAVAVEVAPAEEEEETPAAQPKVEVIGNITDLDPNAETIVTVKGSGFLPNAPATSGANRPPLNGQFAGAYVAFGSYADEWQPSSGAESSTRVGLDVRWAVPAESFDAIGGEARGGIILSADGTFETTLTLAPDEAKALADGNYGIVTYPGGGANYAPFETFTAVTFASGETETPEEWIPAIEIFMADGVTPYTDQEVRDGDELVVKGTGFDPESNIGTNPNSPIPAGQPQGTFIVFGNFAAEWKPSEDVSSTNRVMNKDARQWAVTDAVFDALENPASIADSRDVLAEDGSFTATVTLKAPTEQQVLPANGQWGIYTYAGGVGTVNAAQEIGVKINFAVEDSGDTDEEVQAAGSLYWGVKESFVGYISGAGKITVTEPAGRDGNIFGFPLSSTDAWDAETETGSLAYGGEVNFFAHGGALNITLTNPVIEVLNDNEALLKVEYEGALKTIATVDLSAAQRTANDDGSVTWTGATVIATEGTTDIFGSNYPAGTDLAPVTFTAGAVSEEPIEGGETPSEPEEDTETPVVTPPANESADQCVARAVVGGSMTWGFKASFVNYVNGPIAKGTFTNTGFGASSGALNPENRGIGITNFSGSMNGTGHDGVLDYTVSNPSIQITGPNTGILYATAGGSRVAYANLSFSSLNVSANSVSGNASATLTAAGSATLGDYADMYRAGTAMDPLSFSVTLGGEVPCDDSTDPVALAATGSAEQGAVSMMGIAALLMLAGAGLLGARRRSARVQR